MFQMGLKARRSEDLEDFDELYHQQSDVCMLRMFESFLESAPQLVLQVYIMLSDHDYSAWTGECTLPPGTLRDMMELITGLLEW